ncbi:MAG: class II histone deacetylase [Solirubrobacterales bacterium]
MWHNTGRATGPFQSDANGWFEPAPSHRESVETKRRFRNLLEVTGLLNQLVLIEPRPATDDEICRFHAREYVQRIRSESAAWGGDGGDGATPFGRGSFEVAALSAGGVIAAVDAVLDGGADNAYALVRPPGHHAVADGGMGFCLFGNAAIAAMHARRARGLERVAIVDWDVHHGNGTQSAFYEDPSVLTISVHQDHNFPPDSGLIEETGEGEGRGANVNVPLPPGSGTGAFEAAFDRVVVPALTRFHPDLIIVASGFDANALDPMARMMMTPSCFGRLTERMMDAAAKLCDGHLVIEHEGGYAEDLVPFCGLAVVEALSGIETECRDTMLHQVAEGMGGHELQPHQDAMIGRAEEVLAGVPER